MPTPKPRGPLNLLLCDADDRTPVLRAADGQKAKQGTSGSVLPFAMWPEDGQPDELSSQGWGVLAPEGPEGDRLLALIDPLIRLREAQQQPEKRERKVPILRVPPNLDFEQARRWRDYLFDPGNDLSLDVPRYQLILGNIDNIGLPTQLTQGQDGYVGRLAFSDDAGYTAYVQKVLAWEKKKAQVAQAYAKFFTVHDGTGATTDAFEKLIEPGIGIAKRRSGMGNFPAREIQNLGDTATPSQDEFLRAVATDDPTVLFSLSHGAGTPRKNGWKSDQDMWARQGAMSFGSSAGLLTAADVANRKFIPGGVWFMFACYGAGTPSTSAYAHWLELLAASGQEVGSIDAVRRGLPKNGRPFIAALPQAVLRNPDGPLAFIGHIDLAWSFSYEELDKDGAPYHRPGRFVSVMRSLLEGHRLGPAFRELMRFFGQVNTSLTAMNEARELLGPQTQVKPEDEAKRGHLWMLRQDLAGYMVLGDPAVRLNIDPSLTPKKAAPAPANSWAMLGLPMPADASASASVRPAPIPASTPAPNIEKLENAICQAIVGQKKLEQCAQEAGIEPAELRRWMDLYRQAGRAAINRR